MIIGMSRPRELDDEAWLRTRYVDEGASASEIARGLGCNKQTVLDALHRHDVETRVSRVGPPPRQLSDRGWLELMYVRRRMSTSQIGELVGCGRTTVTSALHRHGIPTRSPSETNIYRGAPEAVARRLDDAAWLRTMYVERGLAIARIADLLGCHKRNVQRALVRHEIPRRTSQDVARVRVGLSEQSSRRLHDADWLRRFYVEAGNSSVAIAEELGCAPSAVLTALRRNGIPIRTLSKARSAQTRAAMNGYSTQRQQRLRRLAADAGEVGRAYTAVIRILGQLDRVPYVGREESRLEREAMNGLYRAQDALAQRLLLGSDAVQS